MLVAVTIALLGFQDPEATRFPDFPEQDALRYELTLRVDPATKHLAGHVDYAIRAESELTSIRLHAQHSAAWSVEFETPDGARLPTTWADDLVTIALPNPVPKDSVTHLRAVLAGTPVDGFYFAPSRYGETIAFTDHYSIRARGWLPCEDHPADRATWHLAIDVPAGLEVTAYGTPTDVATDAKDRRAVVFDADAEIAPYMFSIVVGPFARVAEGEGTDPRIRPHFVYTADVDAARRALRHHGAWLATMERTFGSYAFGSYTTVQCPTRWGGFEAPASVQLSEALFDREDGGVGTLAHEFVHMWFGDAVGYARWREVWLSEGFASYFGPWLHATTGGAPLPDAMRAQRDRWLKSFEGRTKSIRDDRFPHPDQALNSNTYPKGAWVLHMLRGELGDEMFFAAIRRYYESCRGSSVTTADFERVVEAVAGRELGWFFEQWLDRVGCPELRTTIADGQLVVEQVQAGPPYRCSLRVQWTNGDGSTAATQVRFEGRRAEVATQGSARDVVLDPGVELLFRAATGGN